MLQAQKSDGLPNAGCRTPAAECGKPGVVSPRLAVLRLLEGLSTTCAKDLIWRLTSNSEKAAVATRLLKSGTLSEPAQEMLVAVLAETGTYSQHVSVLDSEKLTSVNALKALKSRIRAFSDSTVSNSGLPSYHPRK